MSTPPSTDLHVQFTNRVVMALNEFRRTVDTSPAAACNAVYWVSRLYPWATTNDVAEILAEHHSPALARYYWQFRFNTVVSRA